MKEELEKLVRGKQLKNVKITVFSYRNLSTLTEEQKQTINMANYVILGSYSDNVASRTPGQYLADFPISVAKYTDLVNKPLVVMAIRNPYDIMYMPEVKVYLTVYGAVDGPNIPAGIDVIFGKVNPQGRLPVSIPKPDKSGILYAEGYGLKY
jgi:beta-N-acetylhexosaminidase